jgi:hypothetical protein
VDLEDRSGMRKIVLMISVAVATGCGTEALSDSTLEGSIGSLGYTLDFDYLRITRSESELVLRYVWETVLDNHQAVTNQPVRLAVSLANADLRESESIAMTAEIDLQHAVIALDEQSRQLVDEPDFPTIRNGTLVFEELGEQVGDPVAGTFDCMFVDGFTLLGDFRGELSTPP